MTRTRKWLIATGAILAALLLALLVALLWLVYTSAGLRFALDRGVAMTDGRFGYHAARGTLAGGMTLEGLHLRTEEGTTLKVRSAAVHLQPWALLGKRLEVRKARIDGIALDLAPAGASSESGGFSLKPPLTIALHDTLLTHIAISNDGQPTFAADRLAIAGLWSDRRLVLRQLTLRAPDGHADLEGTVALARGWPGRGKATIDWTQKGTRYAGTITSKSDGRTAYLDASLRAPIPLELAATVSLGKAHAWTLKLDAPRFDARKLPALPESLKTLALHLDGKGDARGGQLDGKLVANGHVVLIDPARFRHDGKTLVLDPLRLRAPSMPGVATVTGNVRTDVTPMRFSLAAKWDQVRLPADLVGQELATHGEVQIDASSQDYALKGALSVGPPGKLSDLQVDLAGTPRAIDLHTLKLVQENGGLDASGSIGLQPGITWNLVAKARAFDPGALLAGWNGAMDFRLATQGTLGAQPRVALKLDETGGTLRGQRIAGSKAALTITPDNLLDGNLVLVAGNSRIEATGKPGPRTDATVRLDIASLGDWVPGNRGALHGRFTFKGAWPKLAVAGNLAGDGLNAGARSIDTLRLEATIPDLSQPGGKLDLALGGVHAAGLDFDKLQLTGQGNAASHRLQLRASGKQLDIAMNLAGSWQGSTKRWTGTLSGLELAPHDMPAWRQQQSSTITWQKGALQVEELCLDAGKPRLCLSASRTANGALSAQYDLEHLPLQLLATVASGVNPLKATGEVSGSGQVTLDPDGSFGGKATLAASSGQIAFASTPDSPLLAWKRITLEASGDNRGTHIRLQGNLAKGGHVDGDVGILGDARALEGHVDVELRDLAAISALSPEIANVQGSLAGRLALAGTLSAPQFQGRIQTQGFAAELPRAGLKLHDGQLAVQGDADGRLAIRGEITSGKGVLHIDGSTGLAADAPLTLNIKGEDVLVADIPAAHVVASPDLNIARADGTLTLSGSITIPSADVQVEKLPGQGPTQASPDVVIVDQPAHERATPLAMNGNVEVKLGDDVKLRGYGLDGSVQGQLAVHVRPGHTATGRGQISVSGKYQAYGQNLTIERGRLLFAGTQLDNPGLDIRAVRKIRSRDVTVGLSVRGTAKRPILTVFSNPAMEQAEALSYLVTGRPLDALKSGEGDTLNTAAQALGGLAGDRLAKSIGSRLGLEAGVSSSEALGGSAFTAGKYLSPRLFLSYGVGLFAPGQVVTLRYTLNRFLQFEAENATTGNRASLNYRIEK